MLILVFAVTGDCLLVSTVGCGNPACITQINIGVLVYVVHAVGCLWSAVVGSLSYNILLDNHIRLLL